MKKTLTLLFLTLTFTFSGCEDDDETSIADLKKQAIENYADIAYANYDDAFVSAGALNDAIIAFVADPTEIAFEACKTAWLNAREPYGQTEVFRFYGGPIDSEDGPEGFINAWPIDENYIDYTVSQPDNGIINNIAEYPTISTELLLSLNESGSETNISTGYHAIEFLLWGQDFSTDGPGTRPYTDYVVGEGGTASNQQRRGQYLLAASALLIEHLEQVRDAWAEGAAYRVSFTGSAATTQSIQNIFDGMGILSKGELAGERMLVAVESHDQENEHSCFSDNTINDLLMNFEGIRNVWLGEYKRIDNSIVSGTSVREVAHKANSTKAAAVDESFAEVETKLAAISSPFDQAIMNDTEDITAAVESLQLLSDRIADVLVDVKK